MKTVESATAGDGSRLSVGSVVRLRAGGPRMVVNTILEGPTDHGETATVIVCVWHTDNGYPCASQYDPRVVATEQ